MKPVTRLSMVILALVCLFGYGVDARAQGGVGELTGIVFDPQANTVAGAKVQLTNTATGAVREQETPATGAYRFVALPVVGTYTLKVEVSGFRTAVIAKIVISVGTVVTQDVHLELGAVTQTVTVEAGVELVQTTESQVSELVDNRVWQSLPLDVRNQNTFINLLPAVVPNQFHGTTRGASVAGARPGMGNFLVEGYDNNDQGQGGRGANYDQAAGAITSISPEAIQEYRVISHSYAAEYGKGGAFVTDTVLKSGTKNWHGSAFEYNRVQALAANNFFSNASGIKDALVRNQFGGSAGGPVYKNNTFFYASYEGHIRRQSAPLTDFVTTQEFLDFVSSGAFETFQETDPKGFCVLRTGATCPGKFANSGKLGPIFSSLLKSQPFPLAKPSSTPCSTDPVGAFCRGLDGVTSIRGSRIIYPVHLFNTVSLPDPNIFDQHRGSLKVDQKISSKDQLSGTFLIEDIFTSDQFGGGDGTFGPAFVNPARRVLIGVSYTRTFTPTIINQFRVSYLRDRSDFPNPPATQGIPDIVTSNDPLASSFGNVTALPQFFTDNQFQYKDDLSFVRGRHTFKAGGEYRRTRNGSSFQATKNGLFEPYGVEDLVTDGFFGDEADRAAGTKNGGFALAQASVNPLTGQLPEYYRGFRANEVALYFQDDWRIRPRLTINAGLRWEYQGPPHNFRKGLDSNFYFGSAITPIPVTTTNPFFPTNVPSAARLFNGGFQQRDKNIWMKDTNNFGPRLGFAWDVLGNQKLVLRGGGGVFYDRVFNNVFENIRFNPPFFATNGLGSGSGSGNGLPAGPLSTPGVYTVPFTSTSLFAGGTGAVPQPRHMDQDIVTAYNEQFFLGTQWEFAPSFVVEVDGLGTLGRKLTGFMDINTYNGRTACPLLAPGGTPRAACRDAAAAGLIPASGQFSSRRVNTAVGAEGFRTNAFTSDYYGLQVVVRKSFSRGLQFNANYTWSKAIDEFSDLFRNGHGLIARPTDNFNIPKDRGNADFDIRHRLVMSYYWEVPWLKNNRWIGGWSFSGITTVQRGVPMQLFDSSFDANRDGFNTDRPVFNGTGNISSAIQHSKSPADGYLNVGTAAAPLFGDAVCPTTVNFGLWCDSPTGRNTLIGPGFVNFDLAVGKKFRVTERFVLQFQAAFFNLFNHQNFQNPVGNLASGLFGQSTATQPNGLGGARVTQLALRLDF